MTNKGKNVRTGVLNREISDAFLQLFGKFTKFIIFLNTIGTMFCLTLTAIDDNIFKLF